MQTGKQRARFGQSESRMAEFARVVGFNLTAKLRGHRLHAIADAEDRHTAVEDLPRRAWGAGFSGRFRTAGQDDAFGRKGANCFRVVIPGPDFAVDANLADAPRDQLRVLRAEIENQDFVAMDVLHAFLPSPAGRGKSIQSSR